MLPNAVLPKASATTLLAAAEAARLEGSHRTGAHLAELLLSPAHAPQPAERAHALRLAAVHRWRLGDARRAIEHARAAADLCAALADAVGQIDALLTLCTALIDAGAQRDALDAALRSLELARRLGDARLECWALNRLALAFKCLDDLPMALHHGRQALALARQCGGDEETFAGLNNLANQLLAQAEGFDRDEQAAAAQAARAEARELGAQALAAAHRSGNVHRQAVALTTLAESMIHEGDFEAAESTIARYRAMATQHGFERLAGSADRHQVCLLQKSGRHAQALIRLGGWRARELARGTRPAILRQIEYAAYVSHKALGHAAAALGHLEAHARLERQAQHHRDRTEALEADRQRLSAQAEAAVRDAREDALTGLPNRRAADETLPGLLAHAEARHAPLALAMLDVDRFKAINDGFGHAVGDVVLTELGQVLRARLRGGDLLARVGGEEFMLALPATTIIRAAETCERLRAAVAAHDWQALAPGLAVTISLGLVERQPGEPRPALVARADAALYRAKREGRDRLVSA